MVSRYNHKPDIDPDILITRISTAPQQGSKSRPKDALKACRGGFLAVVVFSLCINLLMLTSPLFMMQIYDRVLASGSGETLSMLLIIAGAVLLVMVILVAVRSHLYKPQRAVAGSPDR